MMTPDRLDHLLLEACARFGEAPALEDETHSLSYSGLAAAAGVVADDLLRRQLQPDEPVLVTVANAPHDIAAFIGVWTAGGVVVPVARNAPAAATETTRAATGARFIVADGGKTEYLMVEPPPARSLLAGAAIIIFTSGSTGAPKGVVLGHRAFAAKLAEIDGALGFSSETRTLLVLQITFVFGIWVALLTLMKGGSVFMAQRFEKNAVMAALADRQITDAAFVPTMLRRLLLSDTASAWPRRVLTGGEPFNAALGERVREMFPETEIVDIYGLTETTSSDFFQFAGRGEAFSNGIGRISKSERFRVADAQGNVMPTGEVGELQICTPFIMNGYLDAPALTHAAFCGDYFRTGDLARLRPDDTVELVGRSKDLIVRGGAKISPLELDSLIAQHPTVAAALTVGVPDAIVGERIHVLVVPRAGQAPAESEIRQWIAERVERYKRPDAYHFANELPTGRTGKVDRDALRQAIGDGNSSTLTG